MKEDDRNYDLIAETFSHPNYDARTEDRVTKIKFTSIFWERLRYALNDPNKVMTRPQEDY